MSPPASSTPIAAAHLLMDGNWNEDTKKAWQQIRFDAIDILYLSPFGILEGGKFGLENSGDLWQKFNWVKENARKDNSKIKIIAMQFWNANEQSRQVDLVTALHPQFDWGRKFGTDIDKYTTSIVDFVKAQGLDGYDIDYEWADTKDPNDDSQTGNLVKETADILSSLRKKFDQLQDKQYYISISPASTDFLFSNTGSTGGAASPIKDSVSFVNIQNYDGGLRKVKPSSFLVDPPENERFSESQLLCGMDPENTEVSLTIPQVKSVFLNNIKDDNLGTTGTGTRLGGTHLWRLNSDNSKYENQIQVHLYSDLHPGSAVKAPVHTEQEIMSFWDVNRWVKFWSDDGSSIRKQGRLRDDESEIPESERVVPE